MDSPSCAASSAGISRVGWAQPQAAPSACRWGSLCSTPANREGVFKMGENPCWGAVSRPCPSRRNPLCRATFGRAVGGVGRPAPNTGSDESGHDKPLQTPSIEPCIANERRASKGSPVHNGPVHVGRSLTMQRSIRVPGSLATHWPSGGLHPHSGAVTRGETLVLVWEEERQRAAGRASVHGPPPMGSGGRNHAQQPMCCQM